MGRRADFDGELKRLLHRLPGWVGCVVNSVSTPGQKWLRIPLAIGLMIGGLLGFLPVLGFWMLPLGFALFARDLPFLRGPLARIFAFINRKLAEQAG